MTTPLKHTIQYKKDRLVGFSDKYPDVWELIEGLIGAARGMIIECAKYVQGPFRYTTAHMLLNNVYEYQEDSLFLLIVGRTDGGFALLRMASELSRDTDRILENDFNYGLWQKRKDIKHQKEYKKIFRFNNVDKIENFVYSIYNMTSDFGVHGHQSTQIFRSGYEKTSDGESIRLHFTDIDILKSLNVWLISFFAIQNLGSRGFQKLLIRDRSSFYKDYLEMEVASGELIKTFRDRVEELKKH